MSLKLQHRVQKNHVDHVGLRIDKFLSLHYPQFFRADIQRAMKRRQIFVNNAVVRSSYRVQEGDVISGTLEKREGVTLEPELQLSIPIIIENDDIVVIHKPAGIATHPSDSVANGTVANWFIAHHPECLTVGEGTLRPGIVHRLDKDTSGVMVLAKTQKMYLHLKRQFHDRLIQKHYRTLVFGSVSPTTGVISTGITRSMHDPTKMTTISSLKKNSYEGVREATSKYSVVHRYTTPFRATLLDIQPKTGRMHQIRVHLHSIGHPVIGDMKYTRKECAIPDTASFAPRQLLHASSLQFSNLQDKLCSYSAPLPSDFSTYLAQFS